MRVAIAVRRLSARGGMEGNVLALARRLVARGHALTVVCQRADDGLAGRRSSSPSDPWSEPAQRVGDFSDGLLDAEVVRIPVLGALGETAKLLSFARGAARALAGLGADVTFTSGHVAGPRVVRLESGLAAAYHDVLKTGGQGGGLTEWAARRVEARKLACAERILVLSEAAGRDVLARFGVPPERVVVAPNGVDLDRHPRATEAARAEARRALGVEGPVVAFVGSGFWRKGLDRALDALAHPDAPRATLLVAGTDRARPRYEARARQLGLTVRWLGYQADVRPVLAAADALVLPARFEPFGLVALEAWAAGRPAVLSAAVGAAEVSPHRALVVPEPAEPGALARALAAAVALHDVDGCRAAAETHPLEASLDRVVAVMEEVAG